MPFGSKDRQSCPDGVFYTGNLCLSENMIQYQKTYPDFLPQTGDIVAFINTAAYQMDNGESEVLQQRLAPKIAVVETDSGFRWFRDEFYSPLTLMTEDQL
jgi:diaminopimelate decarboxylase